MIFDFLTITGADDNVDLNFLDDMMSQYSHVEWGILFSDKRKGQPRYPSDAWLARLTDTFYTKFDNAFSAHLCGAISNRLIDEGAEIYKTGELIEHSIPAMFSRIQLNSFPERCSRSDLISSLSSGLYENGIDIILQIPDEKTLEACQRVFLDNVVFIHDASRGTGRATEIWPEAGVEGYVGFAGGLSLDNIRATLDQLCARPDSRHFWIDLESGARNDDVFDRKKVEKLLKITEEYIGN